MTIDEFKRELDLSVKRQGRSEKAILAYARNLVSTLRDAGQAHTAKELECLYCEYDVTIQEMTALMDAHPQLTAALLVKALDEAGGAA